MTLERNRFQPPYERGIYLDLLHGHQAPAIGDFILTVGKRGYGSAYLVLRVRRVQRRNPESSPRYSMRVTHIPKSDVLDQPAGQPARIFKLHWYPRSARTP